MKIETILYKDTLDMEQSVSISTNDLLDFWKSAIQGEGYAALEGERAFLNAFEQFAGIRNADSELELGRGWVINLKAGVVKAALSGAYLAAILQMAGIEGVPVLVIPVIIPFLFEISQIKFSKKEEIFYAELKRTSTAHQYWQSPNDLYALLDDDTRHSINRLDFIDFISKLSDAGLADSSVDGRYLLRSQGKEVFRLKIE